MQEDDENTPCGYWQWFGRGTSVSGPVLDRSVEGLPVGDADGQCCRLVLIGLLSGLLARHGGSSAESIRAFAVVGFCGGFTTFSTFSNETFRLVESSQWPSAAAYVSLSVLAGLVAVFVGYALSKGV